VAASRGHRVRLFEAAEQLGGMVRTAQRGVGWERLGLLVDWLEDECRVEGVELVTGRRIDVADLRNGHVIIATGSRRGEASHAATKAAVVRTAAEALDDPDSLPAGEVLVWDPIGGPIGVSVAETLRAAGRAVHIVTPDNIVGNELARSGGRAPANARLQQAGVHLHRRTILRAAKKGTVEVEDRFSGERRRMPAAVVVDAGHRLPDEELWHAVCEHPELHVQRVGDCVAPRTIHEAILEGRRAALRLG
jgi:pyruvate/2-oxoglutarate dehydrogenase complex dihydrolipoamide dehydrogenase (E3) component